MNRARVAGIAAAACMALCLPGDSKADGPGVSLEYDVLVSGSAFTTQAMDASKTTDGNIVRGLTFVTFHVEHTNDSATDIRMSCESSFDGTSWGFVQVLAPVPATGIADSVPFIWKQDVSGDEDWPWTVGILGYVYLRCTFSATGGVSADKLTVTARGGGLQ